MPSQSQSETHRIIKVYMFHFFLYPSFQIRSIESIVSVVIKQAAKHSKLYFVKEGVIYLTSDTVIVVNIMQPGLC